jgi:glycosyltransferase involved in cell wall biosynthesis
MDFSLIIPAYNEEKTIGKVLAVAAKTPEIKQIIVVNDGSTDKTKEIVLKFKTKIKKEVQLLNFKKNRGKGFALWAGLKKALYQQIIFSDADFLNLEVKHLKKLIQPLKEGKTDLVMGTFKIKNKKITKLPKIFKKFLHWLEKNYTYSISGQRAGFKKDFMKIAHLKNAGYGVDLLITDWFLQKGKKIKKVCLNNIDHLSKAEKWGKNGPSSMKMLWDISQTIKYLKAKPKLAFEGIKIPDKKWKKFISLH